MPRSALPLFRPVLPRLVAWVGAQAGFVPRVRVRDRVSFSVSSSCRPLESTISHS